MFLKSAIASLFALLVNNCCFAETDPYLWLEDVQGERALEWVRAQNQSTLAELENSRVFDQLYAEAYAIMNSEGRLPKGEIVGDEFHDFWQDETNVRGVWRRTSIKKLAAGQPEWVTVLDIDKLADSEQENWVYKSILCQGGTGDHCLVELSRGGKDESVYREFSLADRKFVDDGFVIPEAKSQVAWIDGNTLIVATDWGTDSMTDSGYAREARVWQRGKPLASGESLFAATKNDTLLAPQTFGNKGWSYTFLIRLLADWNDYEIHPVKDGVAQPPLPLPKRILPHGVIDDRLVFGLKENWSHSGNDYKAGDIVAYGLDSKKSEIIYSPTPSQAIDNISVGADGVFLQLLDTVAGKIKRLKRGKKAWVTSDIEIPQSGVAKLVAASGSRNDLFVSYESAVQPTTLYYVDNDNKIKTSASLPAL
jgi:prolyl oligopeptidase